MLTNRTWLAIHKWTGLVAGLFVFILSVSGTLLIFDDEIERSLNSDVVYLDAGGEVSLDNAYETVRNKYPRWEVRVPYVPGSANRAIEVELRQPDNRRYLYLHPVTGNILRDQDSDHTYSHWLLELHYTLHSGFWGMCIMTLAGLCLLISVVSGFIVYRRAILDVLLFRIRPRSDKRQKPFSIWHRFIGVWSLLGNFLLVLTGLIVMFFVLKSNILYPPKESTPPELPEMSTSLDTLYDKATERLPGLHFHYLRIRGGPDATVTMYGKKRAGNPLSYEFTNYITFHAETGETAAVYQASDDDPFYSWISMAYPLHFGNWGGTLVKVIYSLIGISVGFLSVTAFLMWYKERQRSRTRT